MSGEITKQSEGQFRKTSPALIRLSERIAQNKPQPSFAGGITGESGLVLAPGKVSIIGAPPGTGKTALAMQVAFEAIESHEVPLVVANAEMDIEELLLRELSRRASVGHELVRQGKCDKDQLSRLLDASKELTLVMPRVKHMHPPFTAEGLGELVLDDPGILVVDYLQKFRPADRDTRSGVDEVMGTLRTLALQGWCVLAMSATARQNSKKGGHDHASLDISSFKESGEIEFNADAAYLLRDVSEDKEARVRDIDLDCVKNRAGRRGNVQLRFCGDFMRFEARTPAPYEDFTGYSGEFSA